jgi:hypothetical protein
VDDHLDPFSEGHDLVSRHGQLGKDFRGNERSVDVRQIALGEPTGPTASPSDIDGCAVLDDLREKLTQCRHGYPMDLRSYATLCQVRRLAQENQLRLVSGFDGAHRDMKGGAGVCRIIRAVRSDIEDRCHEDLTPQREGAVPHARAVMLELHPRDFDPY